MNNKVYTIIGDEELEDEDLDVTEFSWDEIPLFMTMDGGRPSYNSDVLWVVGYGDMAEIMNLGDGQIMLSDVREYSTANRLPRAAKKEFLKACFSVQQGR